MGADMRMRYVTDNGSAPWVVDRIRGFAGVQMGYPTAWLAIRGAVRTAFYRWLLAH